MKFEKINDDIMLLIVTLFNFADTVCKIRKKVEMENELTTNKEIIENELVEEIKELIISARKKISKNVSEILVDTYWNIGKAILLNVSKRLTKEIGKGFSKSNLFEKVLFNIFQNSRHVWNFGMVSLL